MFRIRLCVNSVPFIYSNLRIHPIHSDPNFKICITAFRRSLFVYSLFVYFVLIAIASWTVIFIGIYSTVMSCIQSAFFTRNQQILLYQEITIQIVFWCIISNSFNFFLVLKGFFNKHGCNFDDVSKNGYSRSF